MLTNEIKSKINQLWDKFWSGGISNPLSAIEQMSFLIFAKRLEDLETHHERRAKIRGEKHDSIFKGNEDCRWSHWKNYPAEQMLTHFREKVFPFLKSLKRGEDALFAENMKDAVFIIPKPSLLQEAVSIIDGIFKETEETSHDTLGDVYEHLLSQISASGKNGQFRTPRHIIKMMAGLLKPRLGEKVCDPACGTSGFLIGAYEYLLQSNTSPEQITYDEDGSVHNLVGDKISNPNHWKILKRETLYGFDSDTTMVRISLMNMLLHGIEHPNIQYADSLSKNFKPGMKFDVILANPPFTGSVDVSEVSDELIQTSKTELLFLKLFYNLLQTGGRAAIIVPNGVLFGSSKVHLEIRKLLLEQCQLEAVIQMPSGVFRPYAGVATGILVFTKGGKTDKVWFYEMESDGFSLDDKRNFIDGKGDIPDLLEKFDKRSDSSKSFSVNVKDIEKNNYNLSLSAYKEVKHEDVEYEKPERIIENIEELEAEIQKELKEISVSLK